MSMGFGLCCCGFSCDDSFRESINDDFSGSIDTYYNAPGVSVVSNQCVFSRPSGLSFQLSPTSDPTASGFNSFLELKLVSVTDYAPSVGDDFQMQLGSSGPGEFPAIITFDGFGVATFGSGLGSTLTGTWSANDVFRIETDSAGSTTFYKNGVLQLTNTNGTLPSCGNNFGMSLSAQEAIIDDLKAGFEV